MDQTHSTLYEQYLRAAEFFNAQVERKYPAGETRDLFLMIVRSEQEFLRWWSEVSKDKELQSRWLERFEDPAGSHARNCRRITEELDRIPIRRIAA